MVTIPATNQGPQVAESQLWPATQLGLDPPAASATDARRASDGSIDHAAEQLFHDEWGKTIDARKVPVIESFEACTAPENRFIMSWLGDVRDMHVLDLGCGAGEAAVYFALKGATVTAADISPEMLGITRQVARRYGVRVRCIQKNAECLDLPSNSFDVVYAANLLHHVNLRRCLSQVCRVLAPRGRFVCWDPLRHNPIIKLYRKIAAPVRTADEKPLDMASLKVFHRYFRHVQKRCFWLTSLWIFMRFFAIERANPSKERYWKKIITDANRLEKTYLRLATLDHLLLRAFPWLRRMCWNVALCSCDPRSIPADDYHNPGGAWTVELPESDSQAPHEPAPQAEQ